MDRVIGDVVAEVVGRAIRDAGLDAAAGEPHGEAAAVMVSAVIGTGEGALAVDRATEFAAPDDKGIVEQTALLEVGQQRGGGLVDVATLQAEVAGQVVMLVPASVIELNEPYAPLCHATGEQTVRRVGAWFAGGVAVEIEGLFGLAGEVGQIGNRGLHAIRHLVLGNAGLDFRVAVIVELALIELGEPIQHAATTGVIDARRIGEVEHGIAVLAEVDPLVAGRQKAGAPQSRVKGICRSRRAAVGDEDDERGQILVLAA